MLRQIVINGVPAGVQNSIISVANVFVQAHINTFGATAVAAAVLIPRSKASDFFRLPALLWHLPRLSARTWAQGNTSGPEREQLSEQCARFRLQTGRISDQSFCACTDRSFWRRCRGCKLWCSWARIVTWFYFLLAFSHCMAGILRGAGKSVVPMFVMMVCWCVIRVSYISIVVRFVPDIQVIFWAYPLTWLLSSVVFLIYFLKSDWYMGLRRSSKCEKCVNGDVHFWQKCTSPFTVCSQLDQQFIYQHGQRHRKDAEHNGHNIDHTCIPYISVINLASCVMIAATGAATAIRTISRIYSASA